MSRVGLKRILVPAGVKVEWRDASLHVSGPQGKMMRALRPEITVKQEGSEIVVSRASDDRFARSLHGLERNEIHNMILGVSSGYAKTLEINGVGFRAALEGRDLVLSIGYSHPTRFPLPEGVQATVEKQTVVTLKGVDKYLVGQTAATIRALKPPEPYKGKGIKYRGERIVRKEGKSGKTGK